MRTFPFGFKKTEGQRSTISNVESRRNPPVFGPSILRRPRVRRNFPGSAQDSKEWSEDISCPGLSNHVARFAKSALPAWHNFKFEVQRLRADYLLRRQMLGER